MTTAAFLKDPSLTTLASPTNETNRIVSLPIWYFGIVSPEDHQTFTKHASALNLTCGLIGTVCSAINFAVYEAQHRKSKSTVKREPYVLFLMAICVGDGLFTLSEVVKAIVTVIMPPTHKVNLWLQIALGTYAITVFRRSSVWINALASLERFLTIAFPWGAASHVFRRAPAVIIACVFLLCSLSHIYLFFELDVLHLGDDRWRIGVTPLGVSEEGLFTTVKNVVRVLCFYVPLFGSLLINLLLMLALNKHVRDNRGIKTSRGVAAADTKETTLNGTPEDTNRSSTLTDETREKAEKGEKIQSNEAKAAKLILALTLTFFFMTLPSTLNATVASFVAHYGVVKRELYLYGVILQVFNMVMFLTQAAVLVVNILYSLSFRRLIGGFVATCLGRGRGTQPTTSFALSTIATSQTAAVTVVN